MNRILSGSGQESLFFVRTGSAILEGNLVVPEAAEGLVLFAHGIGQHSSRNQYITQLLQQARLATLSIDLLTSEEKAIDLRTNHHFCFDIGLLAARIIKITDELKQNPTTQNFKIGYFGASTGSSAAWLAAADRPEAVSAIVSYGGRPDLAGSALSRVQTPTLLIVGGNDFWATQMHQEALAYLNTEKQMEIICGTTYQCKNSDALLQVARSASRWFKRYLTSAVNKFDRTFRPDGVHSPV